MTTSLAPVQTGAPTPITSVDELAAAWLLSYSPLTRKAYASDLRCWLEWLGRFSVDALAAHRSHVDAYRLDLETRGLAASTVARRLSALSMFYAYATDEGMIGRDPVARVRRPRASDDSPRLGLDRAELRALLDTARRANRRDHALVCLLAFNGLRISEPLAADVGDLGQQGRHRTLRIVRKGAKRSTVPLPPETVEAIDAMLAGRDAQADDPLFVTRNGARLDRTSSYRTIRSLARRAGITKTISPHSLRHSFVTLALDAGCELRDVQDGAGHEDPRTTRRYDRDRGAFNRAVSYTVASVV